MELNEIRREIDGINREMQRLFERRMELCGQVAEYKGAHGMEIFVPAREEEILKAVRERAIPPMREYDAAFFQALMSLSRQYQAALLGIDPENPTALPERFETSRLRLRPLREEDLPPVFSLVSDPEAAKYLLAPAHTDPAQTLELIRRFTRKGSAGYLATARPTEVFAGVLALEGDEKDPSAANLVLFLDKRFREQDYGGELLEFACRRASKLGFGKLRAWVADSCTPARNALEKAGFSLEQRLTLRGMEDGVSAYLLNIDAGSDEPNEG